MPEESTIKNTAIWQPFFQLTIVIILGLICYSTTFDVPFQFDDRLYVIENPLIKDIRFYIEPSTAAQYNNAIYADFYHFYRTRFVGYLSLAVNYAIHGLDVRGYHVFNLTIHIINAALVYLLVLITMQTPDRNENEVSDDSRHLTAFLSAIFFVSHPVETQAVTYISQRFTSLATLFYILALLLFLLARKAACAEPQLTGSPKGRTAAAKSAAIYCCSIVAAILAMKTKEIAFTLPFVIALYDFVFFKDTKRRRLIFLMPFALTLLIIPFSVLSIGRSAGEMVGEIGAATRSHTFLPRLDYLVTEMRVIVTYLRLIFLPVSQNLDYDYPLSHSFLDRNVLLSMIMLVAIIACAIYLLIHTRRSPGANSMRTISIGIFWFFITLSVESSLIPIEDVIFEHRLYLPSVGAFMSISSTLMLFIGKTGRQQFTIQRRMVSLTAILAVILCYATYERNKVWQDPIALWEDVTTKSPNKSRGFNNLGFYLYKENRFEQALSAFKRSLALNPNYPNGYCNVGAVYLARGDIEAAIQYFNRAILLKPDDGLFHYNLGKAYMAKKWELMAKEQFAIACTQGIEQACNLLNNVTK